MTEEEEKEIKHLAWLVARRSEIQDTALRVLIVLKDKREGFASIPEIRSVLGLMVGTVYSLWRAVFLTNAIRDWTTILGSGEKFLQTLIADNAIAYTQERDNRNWTVGFYINNAKYRILEIYRRDLISRVELEAEIPISSLDISVSDIDIKERWELLIRALNIVVTTLEEKLKNTDLSA